jgi:hypothetical protein
MQNVSVTVGAKLRPEDAHAIAELAEAEGIKPGEFVRRELLWSIRWHRLGISREGVLILGHLLGFQEMIFDLTTAHLRGIDVDATEAQRIKDRFDSIKFKLAQAAVEEAKAGVERAQKAGR